MLRIPFEIFTITLLSKTQTTKSHFEGQQVLGPAFGAALYLPEMLASWPGKAEILGTGQP